VRAKISWTGSRKQELTLGPGDQARFRVQPAGTPTQALYQTFSRASYLRLTAEPA
jgi:hypothetical protein